ncbi:MAG: hypothetical protein ACRC91_07005 [Aeromonas sp.]
MKEINLFKQIFEDTSIWGMMFLASGFILWTSALSRKINKDKESEGLTLFAKVLLTYGLFTAGYSGFERGLGELMSKEIKYIGVIIILVGISAVIAILFQGRKKAIIKKLRKINPDLTYEYLEGFDKDTLENVWIEHEKEIIKKAKEEKVEKDEKNKEELIKKLQN